MKNVVNCFKCDLELDYAGHLEGGNQVQMNQPSNGLAFRTYGHYGSTFFDPFREAAWLEIAICDACMRAHPNHFVASEGAQGDYE